MEYVPQEILNKITDYSNHNIYRIQDDESTMCRFYCIAFIEYMLGGKTLLDYTNFFLQMTIKRIRKWCISILKINVVEQASLK